MEQEQSTATDEIVACIKIIKDLNRKKDVLDAFEELKTLSKGHSMERYFLCLTYTDPNKEGIALLGGSSVLLGLLSHDDIEIQREAVRLLRSISVNGITYSSYSLTVQNVHKNVCPQIELFRCYYNF